MKVAGLFFSIAFLVSACGGSSEEPVEPVIVQAPEFEACGSEPITSVTPATDRTNPVAMTAGQIYQAQALTGTITNSHYWSFPVNDSYEITFDITRDSQSTDNIGFEFRVIALSGDATLFSRELAARTRASPKIRETIDVTTTGLNPASDIVVVEAIPVGPIVSYQIGLFDPGVSRPSPYFTDCPEVKLLDLSTPTVFSLSANDQNGIWFVDDSAAGDYELTLDLVSPQSDQSEVTLQAQIYSGKANEFGSVSIPVRFEAGSSRSILNYDISRENTLWLRFSQASDDVQVQLFVESVEGG